MKKREVFGTVTDKRTMNTFCIYKNHLVFQPTIKLLFEFQCNKKRKSYTNNGQIYNGVLAHLLEDNKSMLYGEGLNNLYFFKKDVEPFIRTFKILSNELCKFYYRDHLPHGFQIFKNKEADND